MCVAHISRRVYYSTVPCSAVQCSTMQCSTVQFHAVQCSAVQCSTVQYSTVQYLCCSVSVSYVVGADHDHCDQGVLALVLDAFDAARHGSVVGERHGGPVALLQSEQQRLGALSAHSQVEGVVPAMHDTRHTARSMQHAILQWK